MLRLTLVLNLGFKLGLGFIMLAHSIVTHETRLNSSMRSAIRSDLCCDGNNFRILVQLIFICNYALVNFCVIRSITSAAMMRLTLQARQTLQPLRIVSIHLLDRSLTTCRHCHEIDWLPAPRCCTNTPTSIGNGTKYDHQHHYNHHNTR